MDNTEKQVPAFEICALYPICGIPGKFVKFSAHVYIIDWDLDIRGFIVTAHKNGKCVAYMPLLRGYDWDKNEMVKFPVVSSINSNLFKLINEALREEALREFETFQMPSYFPQSYSEYLEGMRRREEKNKTPGHTKARKKNPLE